MDAAQEMVRQTRGKDDVPNSNNINLDNLNNDSNHANNTTTTTTTTINFNLPKLSNYKWWLRVIAYIIILLVGQTIAFLLLRSYYDNGGSSKWLATLVSGVGFPIFLPILFFLPKKIPSSQSILFFKLILIYIFLGLILVGGSLMFTYGALYLPISTYSLLCATQLGFNVVTSFFINSQKFTILVVNSVVLLSISSCLLAINTGNDSSSSKIPKGKQIYGFLCAIGASAFFALFLSLVQLSFEKVIKNDSFKSVLNMQVYTSFVVTCVAVVGLFASGEWKGLSNEMYNNKSGNGSYIMTLIGIAIGWQISTLGTLGLVHEVSSLFSNVVYTSSLPLVPIFAVIFFHDKMSGLKIVSLILSLWGFISYVYQQYLDDAKQRRARTRIVDEEVTGTSSPVP